MAFTGYGALKGAASRIDFQGLIRSMTEQEQLTKAAIDQQKREVAFHAEKQKRGSTGIGYLDQNLEQMNKALVTELGTFVNDNPDFETSINKMATYNSITDKFLQNQWMRDGEIANANYAAYTEATTNKELTPNEIIQYGDAWEEYNKPAPEGVYKEPFQFQMPERFSVDQLSSVSAQLVDPTRLTRTWKEENGIAYQDITLSEKESGRVAGMMMADPTYTASIDALWQGTRDQPSLQGLYKSKFDMVQDMVKNSDAALRANARRGGSTYNPSSGRTTYTRPMSQQEIGDALNDNTWTKLRHQLKDNNSIASVDNLHYLTDIQKGQSFNMNDPGLKMGRATYDEEGNVTGFTDLRLPFNAEYGTGAGRLFLHGGKVWAEMDVVAFGAPGSRELLDAGFIERGEEIDRNTPVDPNAASNSYGLPVQGVTGRDPRYSTNRKYDGKVVVPVRSNDPVKQKSFAAANNTPSYAQKRTSIYDTIAANEQALLGVTQVPTESVTQQTTVPAGITVDADGNKTVGGF